MVMGKTRASCFVHARHFAIAFAVVLPGCGVSTPVDAVHADAATPGAMIADASMHDAGDIDGDLDAQADDAGFVYPITVGDGGYIACVAPVSISIAGQDTGFDGCEGSVYRRRANKVCPNLLPRAGGCSVFQGSDAGCHSDVDCAVDAGPYTACSPGASLCSCVPGCIQDSDCPAGKICFCSDPIGQCVPGSCAAGTCPEGAECAATQPCSGDDQPFACQTRADACLSNDDCIGRGGDGCYVNPTSGVRSCGMKNCGF